MKNTMKINQVIVLVTVILIGTSSFAKERNTNKEEKRGVVAGIVVGSAIAGPIGAGVGAILGGGIFGKLVGTSRINRELESELQDQKISHLQEREEMKVAVLKLGIELDQVKKNHVDNWNRGELPVQFRTNSSDIEVHYESELNEIALNLSQNRSSQVTLSGFADRRGRADLNQILSADRVIAVKTYLIGQGVEEKQIVANAFGETKPLQEEESVENNFFDRRVVLQFSNVNASVATR